MTHEDRSNSMNSSAFSCGDRGPVAHPPGGGGLSCVDGSPATCRSLKTARPHTAVEPTGVSNEKYSVGKPPDPAAGSAVIHGCEAVLAGPTDALKRDW